jgi:tetratricopeptide (TPR) repeat protein
LDVPVDGHPCVGLDADWPEVGEEFQTYGYPLEGGSALLSPVSLTYAGKKGTNATPFIDFASRTPVTGGMSGGPLFRLRSGAVCGVLVATRSIDRAQGGLAVPWSALPPSLLDDLFAANARFHQRDRRWERTDVRTRRRLRFGHPHVASHFAGRVGELSALEAQVNRNDLVVLTQAITGLGGIGKTQLAARFVEQHGHEYDVVAWIRAEDAGASDLGDLALAVGLPVADRTPTERVKLILAWLATCDERWLLVLDNLPGPEQLDSACPAGGNGRVLITSRHREVASGAGVLTVDVFDEGTATSYLLDRTGRTGEQTQARALARALGGLPLALSHAGAYCARRTTFAEYTRLLRDLPTREVFDRSPEAFYRQTVASTWQPSIAEARAQAPLATDVIAMAAHLGADRVPVTLFDAIIDPTDAGDRKRLIDAVDALERYSLITFRDEQLSVHRLLQAVVREDIVSAARGSAVSNAVKALTDALPSNHRDPECWPMFEDLLPHIAALNDAVDRPADESERLISLLNRACRYLQAAGAPERSLDLATLAESRSIALLGEEHEETLRAQATLAWSCFEAGLTRKATDLLERVLPSRERLIGREHPDTLTTRSYLAAAYWQAGRTSEAIELEEQVLRGRERVLGDEDPNTVTARANLAVSYTYVGRAAEAIELEELVLANRERQLGHQHPDTLTARANLSWSYLQARRTAEAITFGERVAIARQSVLGDEHVDTLMARANLAVGYWAADRRAEAIKLLEEVLPIQERVLGREHPDCRDERATLEGWHMHEAN